MTEQPQPDPAPDPAQGRWIMLQLMRLGGVLLAVGGLVIIGGAIAGPPALGYGLLLLGLFEFFVMPVMLAKRWKTPKE
ncbi:MAG: hypothetical protein B7Y87_01040 [Sphingomonadales bacterium 32-64-22]|nr:MAG: hypothetical protein B7Y87_01040 [Sphingomonadales bacterium 32-64-22]